MIGVNRVVENRCSSADAEVMALSIAQRILGTWDLGAPGLPVHQMVNNWRPCARCLGATTSSGVRSLVVAREGPELVSVNQSMELGSGLFSSASPTSREGLPVEPNRARATAAPPPGGTRLTLRERMPEGPSMPDLGDGGGRPELVTTPMAVRPRDKTLAPE